MSQQPASGPQITKAIRVLIASTDHEIHARSTYRFRGNATWFVRSRHFVSHSRTGARLQLLHSNDHVSAVRNARFVL